MSVRLFVSVSDVIGRLQVIDDERDIESALSRAQLICEKGYFHRFATTPVNRNAWYPPSAILAVYFEEPTQ